MGDLNARIGQMLQRIMQDEMERDEAIEVDTLQDRSSEDDTINPQGRAFICNMNGLYMPILNGMQLFLGTVKMTYFLANGGYSVLDYALAHVVPYLTSKASR